MQSISQRQHDFMKKAVQDKEYAKKRGISQELAKEFIEADRKANLWEKGGVEKKK